MNSDSGKGLAVDYAKVRLVILSTAQLSSEVEKFTYM
jgi:hypothetical protein